MTNGNTFLVLRWVLITSCLLTGERSAAGAEPLPAPRRAAGQKLDLRVYAEPHQYASFPQLAQTDRELALVFQVQDLPKLTATGLHPHFQPVASLRWAVSHDGGVGWEIYDEPPVIGRVKDISYGSAPRADGGTVTLTFHDRDPLRAILQDDRLVYRPYLTQPITTGQVLAAEDHGPFRQFAPHGMTRTREGAIIAGGYGSFTPPGGSRERWTAVFLKSVDEGRTWKYLSHIELEEEYDLSEPAIIQTGDGRLLAILRSDWDQVPADRQPAEARSGYGYFLYRTESADGGRSWSRPQRTDIWGHPAHLTRLAGGNILMVYGHRRPPYEIRAILSRDEGQTWDPRTQRTIHRFEPGAIDFGYPVATQLPDGTVVCAYYGYVGDDVSPLAPRGVFVSLFDELWMTGDSGAPKSGK